MTERCATEIHIEAKIKRDTETLTQGLEADSACVDALSEAIRLRPYSAIEKIAKDGVLINPDMVIGEPAKLEIVLVEDLSAREIAA